jgi:hypothetical protein
MAINKRFSLVMVREINSVPKIEREGGGINTVPWRGVSQSVFIYNYFLDGIYFQYHGFLLKRVYMGKTFQGIILY